MNKAVMSTYLVFLSLLVSTLVLSNACNDFSQFDCFQQEDGCGSGSSGGTLTFPPMAGINSGGTEMADTQTAGEPMAGTQTAGETMAGTEMASTEMAGDNMAGTQTAGEPMAGTQTAGETMAGTLMAGTEMAGTIMAGTEMAGTVMPGCDPDTFDVLCRECTASGTIRKLENDNDCPEVECAPEYNIINRDQTQVCVGLTTELSQSCVHDDQRSFCADGGYCQHNVDYISEEDVTSYYSAPEDGCSQLTTCTGDEENDITWGCRVNGSPQPGICNQDDQCMPNVNLCVSYALNEALEAGYHLRTCNRSTDMNNRCLFTLDNNHNEDTCDDICSRKEGWSCLGRKNRCFDNNPNSDKCDDPLGNRVCVCQTMGNMQGGN